MIKHIIILISLYQFYVRCIYLFVSIFVAIILPNYIHQFLIYKKLKGFYMLLMLFLSSYVIKASINAVFNTCNGILLVEVYEENSRKICQYH